MCSAPASSEKNVLICSRRALKATLPQGVTNCKCAWQSACAVTSTNPSSCTFRRARQTHQGDFRLTLVSQNQNAKPCSEIPSALAYERMMSFQVSWLTASLFHTSSRDRDAATTCIVAGAKQVSAKGLQQSQTISKKTFQVLKSFFPACLTLNGPLKTYLVGTNLVKSPR